MSVVVLNTTHKRSLGILETASAEALPRKLSRLDAFSDSELPFKTHEPGVS